MSQDFELISPHGGSLINRFVPDNEISDFQKEAQTLQSITLTTRQVSDVLLIADGALSPLTGFMNHDDYLQVLHVMRLANGLPWTIPIMCAVDDDVSVAIGEKVALLHPDGYILGTLEIQDIFTYDKELETQSVYRTADLMHPGVSVIFSQPNRYIGGPIHVLRPLKPLNALYYSPAQSREIFFQAGWKSVVGFQTRNPIHRAHEYIQKCALELVDALFVHPLVGETKSDDIPADVRMKCYATLLENYYPKDRVLLGTFPATMRYAGPREAIFHAIARKNYGCTHFIVGRDHAGVGSFYGPYDAQHIFDAFQKEELGIIPLKFENSFYCQKCQNMATAKTCPHTPENHLSLSGTAVRKILAEGKELPVEFSRPEVAAILREAYQSE